MFDPSFLRIAAGLALLIFANIALGSTDALINGNFDAGRFRTGILKGLIVFLALLAVYLAGLMNPDLMVLETGESQINLSSGIYLLLIAAFTAYGIDILKKLRRILLQTQPENSTEEFSDEYAGELSDVQPVSNLCESEPELHETEEEQN